VFEKTNAGVKSSPVIRCKYNYYSTERAMSKAYPNSLTHALDADGAKSLSFVLVVFAAAHFGR